MYRKTPPMATEDPTIFRVETFSLAQPLQIVSKGMCYLGHLQLPLMRQLDRLCAAFYVCQHRSSQAKLCDIVIRKDPFYFVQIVQQALKSSVASGLSPLRVALIFEHRHEIANLQLQSANAIVGGRILRFVQKLLDLFEQLGGRLVERGLLHHSLNSLGALGEA